MTRIEALAKARELFGDLGMISSDERKPHLVWMIGEPGATMGKGKTWDEAVGKAAKKAALLPERDRVKRIVNEKEVTA